MVVSLLTGAICAVLSGSVVQAINGFTKLRKAFLILDGIMEIENSYFEKTKSMNKTADSRSQTLPNGGSDSDQDVRQDSNQASTFSDKKSSELLDFDHKSFGLTSYVDIFIHSGTRLCYGILLVVFSMIGTPCEDTSSI